MSSEDSKPTMSSEESQPTTITLKTSDNQLFTVEEAVAMEMAVVKNCVDDIASQSAVPLPGVSSRELSKIIVYLKNHLALKAKPDSKKDVEAHNKEFVKEQSNEELIELIKAVNYLDNKDLLDVLNQAVADHIQNKSVEYVRRFFGIENDFTPEEEEEIRKENAWAFEGVEED